MVFRQYTIYIKEKEKWQPMLQGHDDENPYILTDELATIYTTSNKALKYKNKILENTDLMESNIKIIELNILR